MAKVIFMTYGAIRKNGGSTNSLCVSIPSQVVEKLDLNINDSIMIRALDDGSIIINKEEDLTEDDN